MTFDSCTHKHASLHCRPIDMTDVLYMFIGKPINYRHLMFSMEIIF